MPPSKGSADGVDTDRQLEPYLQPMPDALDSRKESISPDEQSAQASETRVGVATLENITDYEMNLLSDTLVETTFDLLEVRGEEERMFLKDKIRRTRERIRGTIPALEGIVDSWTKKVMDAVYPGYTRGDFVDGYRSTFRRLRDSGGLMIGRNEKGEIVGAIGMCEFGEWDGRTAYETTKGIVLPEHRGKGHYSRIKGAALAKILEEHPDSPVVTVSKNPKVIAQMERNYPGTEIIPLGADHPLAAHHRKQIGEPETSKMIAKGNVVIYYDPRKAPGRS
ncbi:MAG: hypothetical protein Q8P27_02065 [Candidatus Peregrinibacteria bacterium]|nr:hypothetical protein [Candidatus Peregrinibacteria bacterium]